MKPRKISKVSSVKENFNFSQNSVATYFKSRHDLLMPDRKCHLTKMEGICVIFKIRQ